MSSVCRLLGARRRRSGRARCGADGAIAAARLRRSEQHAVLEPAWRRLREQDRRRSWRASCDVRSSTSGCRSAAASSAIRSTPDVATSSSGVPAQYGLLQPTRSYYRSVVRVRIPPRSSFAHRLVRCTVAEALTIGIQVSGDDYNNPPAAQALATRQIIQNVRGFTVYGDYSRPDPQRADHRCRRRRTHRHRGRLGTVGRLLRAARVHTDRRQADRSCGRRAHVAVHVRYRDGRPTGRHAAASSARRGDHASR